MLIGSLALENWLIRSSEINNRGPPRKVLFVFLVLYGVSLISSLSLRFQ